MNTPMHVRPRDHKNAGVHCRNAGGPYPRIIFGHEVQCGWRGRAAAHHRPGHEYTCHVDRRGHSHPCAPSRHHPAFVDPFPRPELLREGTPRHTVPMQIRLQSLAPIISARQDVNRGPRSGRQGMERRHVRPPFMIDLRPDSAPFMSE